ncbi:MAG: glycoside hydrolase family 127 protein, partial [Lachnospiraceae bacterium]|nr:glycoside hydrolase family 127 protein [Lachnospiraceae bacterium]
MDPKSFSSPLPMRQVRIGESFWYREQEVVRTRILPYQWNALNDRIPDAAPSYCMHNFRAAAALSKKRRSQGENYEAPVYTFRGFEALPEDPRKPDPDKFYGFVFQDSDFSKWIEAVGYSLMNHPDAELEKTADAAIDIVCEAQLENGYLDTYYILNGMDRAMTNLADHHELYCMGHLIEGAVSYYQATGKDKLLKAAMRFADYMADYFMSDKENSHKGYPGHEIAEMALARLYELTGEKRYLDLAVYFLNERGQSPLFFAEEKRRREEQEGVKPVLNNIQTDAWSLRNPYSYNQAHKPVREQGEAVGHAVRAVYLYSGMADVARLTGDETLYKACLDLWESITKEKLYITGGIGG